MGKAGQAEEGRSRGAELEEVKTKVEKRGSTDAKINGKIRGDKSSRLNVGCVSLSCLDDDPSGECGRDRKR